MMYRDYEQALLECSMNERKLGGDWMPVPLTRDGVKYYRPERMTVRFGKGDQHTRRTMYVRT